MKIALTILIYLQAFALYCQTPSIASYFCPADGKKMFEQELATIAAEKDPILVEAYTLTDSKLYQALALKSGTLILDGKYGARTSAKAIAALKMAGWTVLLDNSNIIHGGIEHPKVMIFTSQGIVRTGSGNFTVQARTVNHEVVYFISDVFQVQQHAIDFSNHRKASTPAP